MIEEYAISASFANGFHGGRMLRLGVTLTLTDRSVNATVTSLESHAFAGGFVLACQPHPASGRVVSGYGERH
jgi:hypothetical protein